MKIIKTRKKIWLIIIVTVIVSAGIYVFFNKSVGFQLDNQQSSIHSGITDDKFTIVIPAIHVNVRIIPNIDPHNETQYDAALKNGVLLMPGTGQIGKPGNAVIYGHSAAIKLDGIIDSFSKLNDLNNGDVINITKGGQQYKYSITSKKIIEPTDLSVLKQTQAETLTLLTCWPPGKDEHRLAIFSVRSD